MANKIFDKETLLDLSVNVIPLFIILFFIVVFLVFNPWGFDPFIMVIAHGLLVVPFVSLAFLTYLSGRAIAGAEKGSTVFPQGQATVPGVGPLTETHGASEEGDAAATADAGETADADPEADIGDAEAGDEPSSS